MEKSIIQSDFFTSTFVVPILNLLVIFYKLFSEIGLPWAFGWAIVLLTVLIRLLLYPFFRHQLQATVKMQQLKPQLDKLTKKYKHDPTRLQQEQLKLYKEAGINPASGCVFALIQLPVVFGLYQTFNTFLSHGTEGKIIDEINRLLYLPTLHISRIDPWFFGFNLYLIPAKAGSWYYLLIPFITVLLQYFQAQTNFFPTTTPIADDKKTENKEQNSSMSNDFQKALNTQMKYFFPFMIGFFSYSLPVGLSLYWNIFSLFSIIQNARTKSYLKPTK